MPKSQKRKPRAPAPTPPRPEPAEPLETPTPRGPAGPPASARLWTVVGIAAIASGLVLRLWELGQKSLWFDEALSVDDSRSLVTKFGSAYHPPLFYYLLHGWMRVAGGSDAVLRLVAAVPGALTVALVFLIGRRLAGPRAGAFAAAVLATASLHLEYSQEVRMYALAAMFAAAAGLALAQLVARETGLTPAARWGWAAAYTALAYAAMATHYLAALVVAGQALALLVAWRRTRAVVLRLAALQIPAVVVALVGLVAVGYLRKVAVAADFLATTRGVNQTLFESPVARLVDLPRALFVDVLPGFSLKWLVLAWYRLAAVALFDAACVAATVALARRRDLPLVSRLMVLVPALLPIPVTILMVGGEQLRFYLAAAPFVALLVGVGLDALRPRAVGAVALAAVVGVSALADSWYFRPGMDKQPWRRVGEILASETRPGDVVLVNEPHLEIALDRYFTPAAGVDLSGYPEIGGIRMTPGDLDRWFFPLIRGRDRVWYVRMSATASHSDPEGLALAWLGQNYRLTSRVRLPGYNGDVDVFVFER